MAKIKGLTVGIKVLAVDLWRRRRSDDGGDKPGGEPAAAGVLGGPAGSRSGTAA